MFILYSNPIDSNLLSSLIKCVLQNQNVIPKARDTGARIFFQSRRAVVTRSLPLFESFDISRYLHSVVWWWFFLCCRMAPVAAKDPTESDYLLGNLNYSFRNCLMLTQMVGRMRLCPSLLLLGKSNSTCCGTKKSTIAEPCASTYSMNQRGEAAHF